MAAPSVNPWSGIKLFEITAIDGRQVCLHETWYHVHIIQRKVEMGWLGDPLEEIKRALREAIDIRPQSTNRLLYVGPVIGRGFCQNNRLHVAVQTTTLNHGVVFTAILK